MACLLISGRSEPCKDSLGGFKYDLRADGNTFGQATVSDKNAGTTVTTQTITLALKKLDKDSSLQVDLMAKGRPIVVIQDRNDNYLLAGLSEGCDLTGSDINSGGARADFNGYNLTFEAQEGSLAPFLDAATITALQTLVSASIINP